VKRSVVIGNSSTACTLPAGAVIVEPNPLEQVPAAGDLKRADGRGEDHEHADQSDEVSSATNAIALATVRESTSRPGGSPGRSVSV
jgi:hypothetical protein